MNKTVARLVGFIGGLILGYCIVLFGWVAYTNLSNVIDRDGGMAMEIAFFFAPIGGVVLGFIGAFWLGRRAARSVNETVA